MISDVVIRCPARAEHNFVLVENEEGEVIFFADDIKQFPTHRSLLRQYRCETGLDARRCLGGGLIVIDYKTKYIRIWGEGAEFGMESDRIDTMTALQKEYPEFHVTIV